MSVRNSRESQRRALAGYGSGAPLRAAHRRRGITATALLLLTGLMLSVFFAPAGQAHAAREQTPEEEAALVAGREAKQAEREQHTAAGKAQRASERSAERVPGQASGAAGEQESTRRVQSSSRPRTHGDVQFSCTGVTWSFKAFPEGANTLTTVATLYSEESPVKIPRRFTFTGAQDEATTPIAVPPGTYKVDAWAKWKGNGLKGSWDILGKISCSAAPALSIEKLQKIAGASRPYSSSPITGELGDTVDYEIVVKNTGNVPLTLAELSDPHCGPVSGGPGSAALAVGASTTYTCSHVLEAVGPYTNTAEVAGTPPAGEGAPIAGSSNPVVAEAAPPPPVPAPAFTLEKRQQLAGAGSYTSSPLAGRVGEVVDYEIIVKNTGNVPLSLGGFSDPQCDSGTLIGGLGGAALPAGELTSYTCSHVLIATDEAAGFYRNTVTVTGTYPGGGVAPVTSSSNTVVVEMPSAASPASTASVAPGASGAASGSSGVLSSTFSQPSKSGVLAFASQTIPTMKGPQGCVRHSFHVSIKSAGVASVVFYLDGHRLRTLTARSARKGLLTIGIDPSKLKVGVHRLLAKITMAHSSSAKARQGSRTVRILRCSSDALTPKFTG